MITFMDRPCGAGKTTALLKSFDPKKRYFCVVPTLSEVERYLSEASVPFVTPEKRSYTDVAGKRRTTLKLHLQELLEDGENIVTTHALFDKLNMKDFSLREYHLCIDEVFDVVKALQGPTREGFYKRYVEDGRATVAEDGRVTPTDKWILEGSECDRFNLLGAAMDGRLYVLNDKWYVTVVPPEMFTDNRDCLINTYMAEGSLMAAYLRKFNIPYVVDVDTDLEQQMKDRAKQRLFLGYFDLGIRNKLGESGLGYQRQGNWGPHVKKRVAGRLKNLKSRKLKGVPTTDILVTCRKDLWFEGDSENRTTRFASDSRLSKAPYAPKNSKGTNEFRHCTHAVHLYDIHLNPAVGSFLDMSDEELDAWRTSELVQWLYRTDIRNPVGGEVQVFFASDRMKTLVEDWLDEPTQLIEHLAA